MSRITKISLVAAMAFAVGACAATPHTVDSTQSGGDRNQTTRRAAGVGQAAVLYARSVHVEPILRPISYLAAGTSLLFQSTSGTLDRLTMSVTTPPTADGPVPPVVSAEPMDLVEFERHLDRVTATRQSHGSIRFLVDGERFFERLELAIEAAETSIDIRTYIFDNDDYAVSIADKLKLQSLHDVRVRVLLDALGNLQATLVDPESMPSDHRAPLSMSAYLRSNSRISVRSNANPWFTGDHVKTTIIDRQIAFVGGMNVGREYRYDWHDVMMEVRGPVVDEMQQAMNVAWTRAGLLGDIGGLFAAMRRRDSNSSEPGYPIRVLQTGNMDSDIYRAQLAAIRSAQQYILIENAYFSDDRIVHELALARRRGVDVRIIIPSRGNHGAVNASNLVTINQMLAHGVRVYLYPGMSHVKAAIYDGWVCVGSANFDKLSLQVNKELNLATSDASVAAALLQQVFIPDLALSEEILAPVDVTLGDRIAEVLVDELL